MTPEMTQMVLRTLLGVVVLLTVALLVLRAAGVPHRADTAIAVLRGAVQLAVISVVLTGVIADLRWVLVALAVMFTVAVVTSTRRVSWTVQRLGIVAASMAAGVAVTLSTVFATGALDLGATPREATADIGRFAIREALIPSTDQTRTTGLVTLPGAFVGAIFGGIVPIEAGRFQIVVLAGIIAAGAVTATLLVHVLAPRMERLGTG